MRICIVLMACLYNKNEQGQVHEPHPDIENKTWTTKFQLKLRPKNETAFDWCEYLRTIAQSKPSLEPEVYQGWSPRREGQDKSTCVFKSYIRISSNHVTNRVILNS